MWKTSSLVYNRGSKPDSQCLGFFLNLNTGSGTAVALSCQHRSCVGKSIRDTFLLIDLIFEMSLNYFCNKEIKS